MKQYTKIMNDLNIIFANDNCFDDLLNKTAKNFVSISSKRPNVSLHNLVNNTLKMFNAQFRFTEIVMDSPIFNLLDNKEKSILWSALDCWRFRVNFENKWTFTIDTSFSYGRLLSSASENGITDIRKLINSLYTNITSANDNNLQLQTIFATENNIDIVALFDFISEELLSEKNAGILYNSIFSEVRNKVADKGVFFNGQ